MVAIAMKMINQGILHHQWTESELLRFQDDLRSIDFLQDEVISLRGERASF